MFILFSNMLWNAVKGKCSEKNSKKSSEAVARWCAVKKVFLEIFLEMLQNSQENTCTRVSFLIKLLALETLVQVFSCEFCKISKRTFSYRTPPVAASKTYMFRLRSSWFESVQVIKDSRIYFKFCINIDNRW